MRKKRKPKLDPFVFWFAVAIIGIVLILLIINPKVGKKVINSILTFITHKFDSFFEWVTLGGMFFLGWLALGKYGNVKFGGPDDEPEFSTFSWIAMLITSGSGAALMYWACAEPIYYMAGPPFGIEAHSAEAAKWAITYGIFHWGPSAWALYCIPAIGIAYCYHVRKIPYLKPRIACRGLLGKFADGPLGKLIDLIVLVGLVGGVGTSLGVCVPMMSACFHELFGFARTLWLDAGIIILWTALFGTTAYLGLHKGIQKLSDWNAYGALGLLAFVVLIGPTAFLISYYGQSVGVMLQNFVKMSTYTAPITESSWPQIWTVFYWAWWGVYAVYMGLFIARVSKGRTIRETVIGSVVFPTIGTSLFYFAFGGYVVHLETNGILNMTQILNEQGAGYLIVTLLKSLPLTKILLPMFIIIGFIYQATTFQGAAYTLASMATDKLRADEQPAPWHRLFWALTLGVVGFVIIILGGLKVLQLSSVILGVPVFIIIILITISFIKWINEDFGDKCSPDLLTVEYEEGYNGFEISEEAYDNSVDA